MEGSPFRCWYHKASVVKRLMEKDFDHLGTEGLCALVPPSYMEGFAEKYPVLFSLLCRKEKRWKASWPVRAMGDYYIISFRKK